MDPQIVVALVAAAIGLIVFIVLRSVFRVAHLGLTLLILAVVVIVVYLLLRGQIGALPGG